MQNSVVDEAINMSKNEEFVEGIDGYSDPEDHAIGGFHNDWPDTNPGKERGETKVTTPIDDAAYLGREEQLANIVNEPQTPGKAIVVGGDPALPGLKAHMADAGIQVVAAGPDGIIHESGEDFEFKEFVPEEGTKVTKEAPPGMTEVGGVPAYMEDNEALKEWERMRVKVANQQKIGDLVKHVKSVDPEKAKKLPRKVLRQMAKQAKKDMKKLEFR